jgi:hypothetical protein
MSTKGNLQLIYEDHVFEKRNETLQRIKWRCRQWRHTKCRAVICQDVITGENKIDDNIVHNHELINGRRRHGEVEKLRAQYGLPPRKQRYIGKKRKR